jgi:V/A-type H+-transporting ATPase subunit F
MKIFLISDNTDTLMGMRLAGIEGVFASAKEDTETAISEAVADPEIGLLMITAKLVALCADLINDRKLNYKRPLVVEVPDREGGGSIVSALERYIGEAVGIRL